MAQEDAAQQATDDFQQLRLLFTDPVQFEYEVIRPIVLFADNVAARSEQTGLDRSTVGEKARRFIQKGMLGLEDQRTRPSDHPANQLTLPLMKEILDIQRDYPRAGKFRVRGLLGRRIDGERSNEAKVGRAMARNRRFHGAPLPWMSDKPPAKADEEVKALPYKPEYRHN